MNKVSLCHIVIRILGDKSTILANKLHNNTIEKALYAKAGWQTEIGVEFYIMLCHHKKLRKDS
jgi:hypothetical protein